MAVVQVLPDGLVNQIAAGEVVERPASVVKELVENALDADASGVDVAIREGGIRWISVTDDGSGLARRDAELAWRRHATSKIRSAADLARVETLGFRGEALPSIAAVASVRMRTRRPEDPLGVELRGEGGAIDSVAEVSCAEGTRVEVADLFARVPARRKFLKSSITEAAHIVRWIERISLARPDLRFALEREGRPSLLFLPTADARERAIAVLPASVAERLVPVSGQIPSAELMGYATPTDLSRAGSGDIHLLVNARPVRDRLLLHAVHQAYRDALAPGRHPAAVLYLRVDPGHLDVNVHPAKSEVRFRDPGAISGLVRDSLVRAVGLRPAPGRAHPGAWAEGARPGGAVREASPPADLALLAGAGALAPAGAGEEGAAHAERAGLARPPAPLAEHRYLGQALGTYLILEGPGALVLLDQHAAHERVLFERLRQTLLDGKLERQTLLVPIWVELARSAADALAERRAQLERAGFELELGESGLRGGVRVGLRAVPALLASRPRMDYAALLEETAASLRDPAASEIRGGVEAAVHDILATAACHAAARKGDRLEPREVQALLEALDEAIWFPNCPHGRPILLYVPEAELERRFGRR